MTLLTPRFLLLLIALMCGGALGAAFIGEFYFGLKPCALCLYQRSVYIATLSIATCGLCFSRRRWHIALIFLSALFFFGNASLAIYQVLVEKKILALPEACKSIPLDTLNQTFAQFKQSLSQAAPHVPCDHVNWELFGISMAGYNVLFTLLCAFACLAFAILFYAPLSTQKKRGPHDC